jgi:predicted AlkP superfamily phosphohydrolase/phosphomutase
MSKKVYVLGLAGMMSTMYHKFAEEGVIPNLKRLADNGIVAESYSSIPAWTPTNWATLMTGAHTGTHTVSRWFQSLPEPRNAEKTLSSFVGSAVSAETIFEAADRAGLKSIAIHYPAASPSRAELAHVIDGFGHPSYGTSPYEVTPALGYTTLKDLPSSYVVELEAADGWQELPASQSQPLEFLLPIVTKREGEDVTLYGLVIDSRGAGYDTVAIYSEKDGRTELARSTVGDWSDWVRRTFAVEGAAQEGVFRFKTIELSPDAQRLRLYRSQITFTRGISEPPELADELIEKFGPYLEYASVVPYVWGIADLKTCLQEIDYQCRWVGDVGKYLMEEKDYSLLYTHIHIFDYLNHHFLSKVDPACPGYVEAEAEEGWQAYRDAYVSADRLIEYLMNDSPEETSVVVISDHAAIPQQKATDIYGMLIDNGYLVRKDGSREFDANQDSDKIDMERSKVFVTPVRSYELFVNAPEGSKEYLEIQRDVITLLRTWMDKSSGRCPVAIALPKVHAPLLGLWGPHCGDIIFIMEDGYVSGYTGGSPDGDDPYVWEPDRFGAHHGPYLPTARTSVSSNMAFFMVSGPGMKRGYQRQVDRLGFMHQTSVVPIVCHLLGIEPPDQCQGALPRDFLEGVAPVMERPDEVSDWEWGTNVDGWGDRVWTQKRDMFEGFMPGRQD